MKKSKQSGSSRRPAPIQFRPGSFLQKRLHEIAQQWSVGVNEAARRMATLPAAGLSPSHYEHVLEYAAATGDQHDFERSCEAIYRAIANETVKRERSQEAPINEDGIKLLILELIKPFRSS